MVARADGTVCAQPHMDVILAPAEPRHRCTFAGQPTYCIDAYERFLNESYGHDWRDVTTPRARDVALLASRNQSRFFDACSLGGARR